ncbi:hypothetical protein ACN469_24980 [Corallococcus terminator]
MSGLTGCVDVAAGKVTSFAIKSNGTLWSWGFNTAGELGDGTRITRHAPVQVPGLTNVSVVAAGEAHVLWGCRRSSQAAKRPLPGTATACCGPRDATSTASAATARPTLPRPPIKSWESPTA